MNYPSPGPKSQSPIRKSFCLRVRCHVGLGMLLMAIALLGCGSDNKGVLSSKKDKAASSSKMLKQQGPTSLLTKDSTTGEAREMGKASTSPPSQRIEVLDGMTQDELEASFQKSMEEAEKAKAGTVVLNGMTQEELEADAAESEKRAKLEGGGEIFPGVTQAQMEAMASRGERPNPALLQEMFPGATQEQINASSVERAPNPREIFPPSE